MPHGMPSGRAIDGKMPLLLTNNELLDFPELSIKLVYSSRKMADDMDDMAAVIASSGCLIMAGAALELHRRKRKKRTVWVKPLILRAGSSRVSDA